MSRPLYDDFGFWNKLMFAWPWSRGWSADGPKYFSSQNFFFSEHNVAGEFGRRYCPKISSAELELQILGGSGPNCALPNKGVISPQSGLMGGSCYLSRPCVFGWVFRVKANSLANPAGSALGTRLTCLKAVVRMIFLCFQGWWWWATVAYNSKHRRLRIG